MDMGNASKFVLLLVIFLPWRPPLRQEPQIALVQIIVVDGTGRNLGRAEISTFTESDTDKDYGILFRDGQGRVPFGDYVLKVHSPGFFTGERQVQVFQPSVWVVVGLDPGAESRVASPLTRVTGKLIDVKSTEKPVYLHLSGLYLDFRADTKLDTTDQFEFRGRIPTGKFLLTTAGRSGILDIQEVDIPTTKPLLLRVDHFGRTHP
jgi:hypothetical protein